MICPNCKSDSTRKFSIIFEEGTYTQKYEAKISSSSGSADSVGEATGSSDLAKRCSPPEGCTPIYSFLVGFAIGAVLWIIVVININAILGHVLFIGIILFLIKCFRNERNFNKIDYPKIHEKWRKKWLCMKCGHEYMCEL